jgi:hypothetical protein
MGLQNVECGLCGVGLGLGIPGTRKWCGACARDVVADIRHGNGHALAGAALAVGGGLLAAYALSRLFGRK